MKKLVFLHGAGSDKNAYNDLVVKIAKIFAAEPISFNAPFPHPTKPNKYVWFNKIEQEGRRDAIVEDYYKSLEYIKEKLQKRSLDFDDIILFGHSQGGGLAVHIGLELKLNKVISVSGDLPYNIEYKKKAYTPIYWFEGAKDTYINQNRKDSYKILQKIDADLHYKILPNSNHNNFADDLLYNII